MISNNMSIQDCDEGPFKEVIKQTIQTFLSYRQNR